MIDRLLVSALVELRSEERLRLLSVHLEDPELRAFYARLADSEDGHGKLFLRLARKAAPEAADARLAELARVEAHLIQTLPLRPGIH
jgi:tRNA-(ms[2]io[6]A)-hydroxylase